MILRSDRLISIFNFILGMNKFGGIRALAFYPFIIVSKKTIIDDQLLIHEKIHLRQQRELLVIPFYIWYLIALWRKGYHNISFEKEAYDNDTKNYYLSRRPMFAFLDYL
jgi:hypothetical protein